MEVSEHLVGSAPDPARRKFLTAATAALGSVGLGFAAVPFVLSWRPSERARALAAPVTVDVSQLESGQMIVAAWRRQPIYIVRRPATLILALAGIEAHLKDPLSLDSEQPPYAQNRWRARRPELFVSIGTCTHLGCLPKLRLEKNSAELGADWPGGFFCPCHGSRFDIAGRVFEGSPASTNLRIPPYAFSTPQTLVVGDDSATNEPRTA